MLTPLPQGVAAFVQNTLAILKFRVRCRAVIPFLTECFAAT